MSGPKSYSCRVFNKQLLGLFMQQAAIDNLWELLHSRRIVDKQRGIEITNDDFIRANAASYQELWMNPGVTKGKVLDQQQFDNSYNWMQAALNHHQKLKTKLEAQHQDFDRIEEAWHAYLDLELFKKDLDEEFMSLKNQMFDYLKSLKIDKRKKEQGISRLAAMEISYVLPEFPVERIEAMESIRQNMIAHYNESKRQIGMEAGIEESRKRAVFHKTKVKMLIDESLSIHNSDFDLDVMLSSIRQAIAKIESASQAVIYKNRLQKILKNNSGQESYFFAELFEDLKKYSDKQEKRISLEMLIQKLPEGLLSKDLLVEINKVRTDIDLLMQQVQIKNDDLARIEHSIYKIKEKQAAAFREQQYIKSNIVACLNDLNYTVADDTELIDLESSDDFLLSIPGQSNYLNLRFDTTGNVLYNFLIPDEPDSLSYDEKSLKYAEMQDTCTAFKKVLADLKSQGLNIDLQHEILISEKALVALPRIYRSKLNPIKTAKPAKQKPGSIHRDIKK